jgi:hypothetical protein
MATAVEFRAISPVRAFGDAQASHTRMSRQLGPRGASYIQSLSLRPHPTCQPDKPTARSSLAQSVGGPARHQEIAAPRQSEVTTKAVGSYLPAIPTENEFND